MAGLALAEQLHTPYELEREQLPVLSLIVNAPVVPEVQQPTEWLKHTVGNITTLELVSAPAPKAIEGQPQTNSFLSVDEACPAELQKFGRSWRTVYRAGIKTVEVAGVELTLNAPVEITQSPEALQAKAEFYTSVEEGFGTDQEIGETLEVRDFEIHRTLNGKVMSKNTNVAISKHAKDGLKNAQKAVALDPRFAPQLTRCEWDDANADTVDAMARGETDFNTIVFVSPYLEEAVVQSGEEYWQDIGYVPLYQRGFIWMYHASSEDAVLRGSLSFDGSDKKRVRGVWADEGVAIPEDEITDNFPGYAITGNYTEAEAKELAIRLANKAGDPKYNKTANTAEITREHREIMDKIFNESYIHACESLVRGYQTPGARQVILQLANQATHFKEYYEKALYKMRANPEQFTQDDMGVVHDLLVYSTVEMMRALHLKKVELPTRSQSYYERTTVDANYLHSLNAQQFQSMLGGFGAEGARNNRIISACGSAIKPGKDNGNSLSFGESSSTTSDDKSEGGSPSDNSCPEVKDGQETTCPYCKKRVRAIVKNKEKIYCSNTECEAAAPEIKKAA